jgi:hypothetical protein
MRLVGIERDSQNATLHIFTFECAEGHLAIKREPGEPP